MAGPDDIEVTVVLAEPGRQSVATLQLARGTTAGDALERSGLLAGRDDLDRATLGLAVYGRRVEAGHPLEGGDRLEVLRPLPQDPRSRRRQLAREGRSMGRRSTRRG